MARGPVNQALLESFYQDPGEIYQDNMTEGAFQVVVDQVNENAAIFNPDGSQYLPSPAFPGIASLNVLAQIQELNAKIQAIVGANIPPGSISTSMIQNGAITWQKQQWFRFTEGQAEAFNGTEWVPVGFEPTLSNHFGWAGYFPFSGPTDEVISTNTTWNDAAGYRKVKKLTIAAGVTLTIGRSPFIIFADEIEFGDTGSTIDASGPSGSLAGVFGDGFAAGGTAGTSASARAQGGCGGGILFVVAKKITGLAGKIKANGGDGFRNTTNAGSALTIGGQGALYAGESVRGDYAGRSNVSTSAATYMHPIGRTLGDGGGATGGTGGGSSTSNNSGGGSGIGGGGSGDSGTPTAGKVANMRISPDALHELYIHGCLGGGGGGASINTAGAQNRSGGGGAGAVVVYAREFGSTPAVEANGGLGVGSGSNGAAGVTYIVQV